MNDQNYNVMPNENNNAQPNNNANNIFQTPINSTPQAPVRPAVSPQSVQPVNPVQSQPVQQPVKNNAFEAPKEPQVSNATFDYNQLYGNKKETVVEHKEAFVFEEPDMETSATIVDNEPTITISNDELIPEFDASVLEVIPEQEKQNISSSQATANISSMATEKQAEQDKSRSNIIFIAVMFGIILIAVLVLFPMLVKM